MRIRVFPILIGLLFASPAAGATAPGTEPYLRIYEFGFRAGSSISGTEDFNQYELFTTWQTPWTWSDARGTWTARLELQAGGGLLRNPEASAGFGYAGPAARLSARNVPVYVTLGFAPTYLTRHRFGEIDFGQRLQFTSSASVTWMLTEEFGLRYRIQHMSNARLADPNPGLDTHAAGIVIAF